MQQEIELSIVIVSYNTKDLLNNCISSVAANLDDVRHEFIIVDNASSDGTKKYLEGISKKNPNIRIFIMNKNLGFGAGNNFGIKKSKGKYLLLLNTDTEVAGDVVKKLLSWMEVNPSYGVVSPNLFNKDGSVQGTGGYFPTLPRVFSWMTIQDMPFIDYLIKPFHPMKSKSPFNGISFYNKEKDLDWLTGAFLLMRKKVCEDVGLFDETFFMYTEEVEYFIRIKKKGWKVRYLPLKGVMHLGGASGEAGSSILKEFEGIKKLYKKHYPNWQYPILRVLLKLGCVLRAITFWILGRGESSKIYAKAYELI